MWSIRGYMVVIVSMVGLILQTEATIKVISIADEKTEYIIEEKPILTNIDSPLKGMLVIANPTNACKPLVPAPPMPINMTLHEAKTNASLGAVGSPDFSWVLLVSWKSMDECSISTKADNALAAGYSVILFEDPSPLVDLEPEALSPLLTPVVTSPAYEYGWTDANVYAYTVDPEDWKILKNNFTSDEYYLTFEDSSSMTSWFTYFLLGILVIGAVFFTIALSYVLVQLLVLILIWIRESIVSRIQQIRRDRRRRLPPSQLKKIPIQQWNSDMLQDICSICLESFVVADRVRILPCSHVFHQACIDPWLLKQRRKCPNCKRKIVFPEENRDSDSSSDDERTPLIRRSSSSRESATTSPRNSSVYQYGNSQSQRRNGEQESEGPHRGLSSGRIAGMPGSNGENMTSGGSNQRPGQQASSSINSSMNTSSELASGSGNHSSTAVANNNGQQDIKGRVEQLCARMENVGRKIRKKVKVNQASKLDNDSSSDMSTGIQPVLVSVTVEPNNIPDSDGDKECQVEDDESQPEANPSSSNAKCCGNSISQNQESSSSQLSPELEVKVVPESFTSNLNNTNNTAHPETTDGSILPDLNA